ESRSSVTTIFSSPRRQCAAWHGPDALGQERESTKGIGREGHGAGVGLIHDSGFIDRAVRAISFFHRYFSWYACFNIAMLIFFMGRNPSVKQSLSPRVPFLITSQITTGHPCHETPYLSLSQPHCSDSGTPESFSQK